MEQTYKIQIRGQVQGVGFRPFVYGLAIKHRLNGSVSNNENGVTIYCNTTQEYAKYFLAQILDKKPEIAEITSHSLNEITYLQFDSFTIETSNKEAGVNIPLTPDFAICPSCKKEIHSAKNRRYFYAFTTCVNCGPRYAITQNFPFERENTSMKNFRMCETCLAEYTDPTNRRFHSQTNSCHSCGVDLQLVASSKEISTKDHKECITKAVNFLKEGKILAIKNTNGYLLCCDAKKPDTIKLLRHRKHRPEKPFAVLYSSLEAIENDFEISALEKDALMSRVAPIVILNDTKRTSIAVKSIAPYLSQTGVMLPSSALLELLMAEMKSPIVATSGNLHGSPIISVNDEAQEKLSNVTDYFLHHNMDINFPQDDSVIKFVNQSKIILRRSRGMAPNYITTNISSDVSVLAMGGHLKSTFTFVPNTNIYVSQYFGNLDNYEVLERYKNIVNQYVEMFETYPDTILIDKHYNYQSTILGHELATEWKSTVQEIQHHKAHFASVLGEHELFSTEEKVLGVIWDGTGLGDDYQIWGGEFFTYQNYNINRLTHVEYYDWLANDKMANEPRIAFFCLLNNENIKASRDKFTDKEWSVYTKMLQKNSLKTSSVGRLFDAVASAIDIIDQNTYEAEASLKLENYAKSYKDSCPIDFLQKKSYDKLPSYYLLAEIVKAYNDGIDRERLAYSFIFTLAKNILKVAKENSFKIIACSGGVFQNELLTSILQDKAKKENLKLKLNHKLSPNDENLSFGQFMYSQYIKK